MQLNLTPSLWPALLGAILLAGLALYAVGRRSTPGAAAFAFATGFLALYLAANSLQIAAVSFADKMFWVKMEVAGGAFSPPALFVFALFYTGRGRFVRWWLLAGLVALPLIAVAGAFTNELHGFYWRSITMSVTGSASGLDVQWGWGYWCLLLYSYGLAGLASLLFGRELVRSTPATRGRFVPLIVGAAASLSGDIVGRMHLLPWDLNFTTIGLVAGGAAFAWALFYHRVLDLEPVAWAAVVAGMRDGVLVMDRTSHIVNLNPSAKRILHRTAADVIGRRSIDVLAEWCSHAAGHLADGEPRFEVSVDTRDGHSDYELELSPLLDTTGRLAGQLLLIRDATERKAMERQLAHQAFYDPLTLLANRRLLLDRLADSIVTADSHRQPLGLLFLDLDGFKRVNDTLGHAAGDDLLFHLSRRLEGAMRASDLIARFGGDEFAVLLHEGTSEIDAIRAADRVLSVLQPPFLLAGLEVSVRTSIGVAVTDPNLQTSPDQLLRQADVALYAAKAAGKQRAVLYSPDLATDGGHFLTESANTA